MTQVALALLGERAPAVSSDCRSALEDRLEHVQPPDEEGRPAGARIYVVSTGRAASPRPHEAIGHNISSSTTSPEVCCAAHTSGYKACFELGVTEVGCMAYARRKFHELWANHGSPVGEQALKFFGALYDVERELTQADADSGGRLELRRRRSKPVADALHQWMRQQRQKIPDGSATAKAIDFYEDWHVKPRHATPTSSGIQESIQGASWLNPAGIAPSCKEQDV